MDENEKIPTEGKRLKKGGKTARIAALCAAAALAVGFGGACIAADRSTTILRGVSAFGIDFGGQTVEQARETLVQEVVHGENAGAEFRTDEAHKAFRTYEQLGMYLDCAQTAQALYDYGRGGNVLTNGWQFVFAGGASVAPVWDINETQMKTTARELSSELSFAPVEFSYTVDENGLCAVKPCDGQTLTADAVIDACEARMCTGKEFRWELGTESPAAAPENGDYKAALAGLLKENAEPCVNASYDKSTDSILPERAHVFFDLDDAVAKMDAAAGGETVCITKDVEYPRVTAEELRQVLFRDILGTYTTKVGGAAGRHKNVQLTASRINGYVMNSGESIKYGELTTPFTLANGYYLAPMYLKGKTVDGAGGGACQASSTLYAASLLANLEIVQRINHGFASDYIGLGLDATVAEGGPEFEVRNNTDYPIKVQAIFANKDGKDYITVNILGTKTDDTYVKIRTEVLSTTPYEEEIVETDELAPGVREVEQTAYTGYLVKTYRQLYSGDGKLISETFEATSKYNARNRIVKVGRSTEPVIGEQPIDTPTDTPTEPPVDPPVIEPVVETEIPGWLLE